MSQLHLFSVFHLNLMYSSIAESQRKTVIDNCYWPLINLCEDIKIPIGLEFSGATIEIIGKLDPQLIAKIKQLIESRLVEIIGSGYSQIIAPLVPAAVNGWNQKLGLTVYKQVFNVKPRIALINEQAYSSGLLEHYIQAGYKGIIMEWNNPYSNHKEWNKNWRYYPQIAINNQNQTLPVIWNNCVAFQKFQRYAQGEIEMEHYLQYLIKNLGTDERLFCLYCNDTEIFDFRPGRYMSELTLHQDGEWNRIRKLYQRILFDSNFKLIAPSDVLQCNNSPAANNVLHLESANTPIPVKKQDKYNITRWAISGRNDADINARCYRIYDYFQQISDNHEEHWKQLCWFWSSDFRTHIEENRWNQYNEQLEQFEKIVPAKIAHDEQAQLDDKQAKLTRDKFKIELENDLIKISFNIRKGLTIFGITYKKVCVDPLFGTIEHGYFDDISYAVDFFSGGTIIEPLGLSKITDLEMACSEISLIKSNEISYYSIRTNIKTQLGFVKKEIRIELENSSIELIYNFDLLINQPCSIRSGIITLIPTSFDVDSLYYKTNNGGQAETFKINKKEINHQQPINNLITANHCLGATDQWIEIGDKDKFIKIISNKSACYNVPMIQFNNVDDLYLLRLYHSLQEVDDTYKQRKTFKKKLHLMIIARKNAL